MIKLHALKIDVVATLGKRYWLTEVRPVYKYTDNKKTDEIDGYRYTIVLPERGLEKISVKIEGKSVSTRRTTMWKSTSLIWSCISIG